MPNLNPARMSAPEIARLLNSTRFGFVLPQNRVYRDFNRAGFRIAAADDSRSIHLVRYVAFLVDRHNAPEPVSGARSYEERRDAERQRHGIIFVDRFAHLIRQHVQILHDFTRS